jgi:hypothetical protein
VPETLKCARGIIIQSVRFQVLMVESIKMAVFWKDAVVSLAKNNGSSTAAY